ncbi:cytochrome b562 [Leeia sp. TBRC 13508]|uniref:Cytochrome b562 n=1 Tax=Leeia speluncae TaxID=2884804 RepID=A0ABS8D1N0_9NEIS|nr:cytochrome b562 [Leeia speluncae]MCB6182101.1 cytochrome b562 [Leeia speluncae]
MKKGLAILSSAILSCALFANAAFAASEMESTMKDMKKSYKAAAADSDTTALAKNLKAFRTAVEKAKTTKLPSKYDKKTFDEGITKLLAGLDNVDKLVAANKVPEAKAELDKLRSLMKEYHKKLKV